MASTQQLPQSLRPIAHYVKIANENAARDPIVYYWCWRSFYSFNSHEKHKYLIKCDGYSVLLWFTYFNAVLCFFFSKRFIETACSFFFSFLHSFFRKRSLSSISICRSRVYRRGFGVVEV